jgi:hypothetical protein
MLATLLGAQIALGLDFGVREHAGAQHAKSWKVSAQ